MHALGKGERKVGKKKVKRGREIRAMCNHKSRKRKILHRLALLCSFSSLILCP